MDIICWCVKARYYDNGRVQTEVCKILAYNKKPQNECKLGEKYDEYKDYFDTEEEAKNWEKQCHQA